MCINNYIGLAESNQTLSKNMKDLENKALLDKEFITELQNTAKYYHFSN